MWLILSTLLVYIVTAAAVFGVQLVAVTAVLTWRTGSLDIERDAMAALLIGVPASSLTLIGIALVVAGRQPRARLRLLPSRLAPRDVAVAVLGILALSQALDSLVLLLEVGTGPALEWMNRTLASASRAGLLLAVIVVGLLAPVGEELFFRGYMLTRLRRAWSAGPAILVTAIAFGVIHGEWVHGVLAAGIGIYLGVVAERAGSVVPAIVCHVANNTASVLLSALVGSPRGRVLNAVLVAVSAVIVAWALRRLARVPSAPAA